MRKMLALSMLLVPVGAIQAATMIYTSESEFLAQFGGTYYLEDFTGISNPLGLTEAFGPVNSYSYTASADNGLYANPDALTTYSPQDELLFTFSGAPVSAVGGIFTATDDLGGTVAKSVTIQSSDGTYVEVDTSGFVGLISDFPIGWFSVTGAGIGGDYYPQADHLFVGASIPEPSILLASAIGVYGILRRTRM